ncbi:MAG: hypothetical protein M5R36_14915 [Deltaproteobacteria bacterium]|nr:hypothetical protein [Deltaproteobacteria bacterium]
MLKSTETTSLIDIRRFLERHGAALAPWGNRRPFLTTFLRCCAVVKMTRRFGASCERSWRVSTIIASSPTPCAAPKPWARTGWTPWADELRTALGSGDPGGVRAWLARPIGGIAVVAFPLLARPSRVSGADGGSDDDDNDDGGTAENAGGDDDANSSFNNDCDLAEQYAMEGQEGEVLTANSSISSRARIFRLISSRIFWIVSRR